LVRLVRYDENAYILEKAIEALGNIADRRAINSLLKVIRWETLPPVTTATLLNKYPNVKIAAFEALRNIGDPLVMPALLDLLQKWQFDPPRITRVIHTLGELASRSEDIKTCLSLKKALWWLRTNDSLSLPVFNALEQTVNRIDLLELRETPLQDPMLF
jgi:hypothetical protein